MRHRNAISNSYFSGRGRRIYSPYRQNYTFTRPTKNSRYVQVMKYIIEHPNCKRFDILVGVFGIKNVPGAKYSSRGHMSSLFSNMLYFDIIDYNNNFEYRVTEKGKQILRNIGITEFQIVTKVTI